MIKTRLYTKESWYVKGYSGEHEEAGANIVSTNDKYIATTGSISAGSSPEMWQEYYGNADLIALAPEMMEIFKEIADIDDSCLCRCDTINCCYNVGEYCAPCYARHIINKFNKNS